MIAYQYMALEPTKYFLTLTFYYKKKNSSCKERFLYNEGQWQCFRELQLFGFRTIDFCCPWAITIKENRYPCGD